MEQVIPKQTKQERFENFARHLILKGLSNSTIEQYLIYYNIFPHTQLSQNKVETFLISHTGTVARGFLKNYLTFLKNKDIEIPKRTGVARKRLSYKLTDKEINLLRLGMYHLNLKYGLMFDVSLVGGLRRDELTKIKVNDFEWDEWTKEQDKPCRLHIIGKGDKERIIIIPPKLTEKIKLYLKSNLKTGVVTTDASIWKMGNHRWWEVMKEVSKTLLNKRIHPHILRHTFATKSWESGAFDILDIRNLLGHSNIATTEKYLHTNIEKSLKKMEDFLLE